MIHANSHGWNWATIPILKFSIANLPNFRLNGTLSPSIGNLDSLVGIGLGGNNLTGTIPMNLTKLTSLKKLDVSGNKGI